MRSAGLHRRALRGGSRRPDVQRDPQKINPLIPSELVIDHSVIADSFWRPRVVPGINADLECPQPGAAPRLNKCSTTFSWCRRTRHLPPGGTSSICPGVVFTRTRGDITQAYPDTLVGTDSHTTMINGIGVVGWGVGGIEAEAGMLGQPVYFLTPDVVGVNLTGALREGAPRPTWC